MCAVEGGKSKKAQQKILQELLKEELNVDINLQNKKGETALMLASEKCKTWAAEKLLNSESVAVDAKDYDGTTAVMHAVNNCKKDMEMLLLNKHPHLTVKNNQDQTALQLALEGKNKKALAEPLMNAEDIDITKDGQTPLVYEILAKDVDMVKKILKHNPDMNAGDKAALAVANEMKKDKKVKAIIKVLNEHDKKASEGLFGAVRSNQPDLVDKALKNGADINEVNENGVTALMFAIEKGKEAVINRLLEEVMDLNKQGMKFGETALIIAAKKGDETSLQALLDKNAQIDAVDKNGQTALMHAATHDQPKTVEKLIKAPGIPADMDKRDSNGNTALMLALEKKKVATAEVLYKNGADLNLKNNDDDTALIIAAVKGDLQCIPPMVAKGADISIVNKNDETPLMALLAASKKANPAVVEKLITPDTVNMKSKDGATAISLANKLDDGGEKDKVLQILQETSQQANKPLFDAIKQDNADAVQKAIVENGADVNAVSFDTEDGDTALMTTVNSQMDGKPKAAQKLLDNDADVNLQNKNGNTALLLAAQNGLPEIMKLLIAKKAKLDIKNSNGDTALMCAARGETGDDAAATLLLAKGDQSIPPDKNKKGDKKPYKNKDGDTVLTIAAASDMANLVATLMTRNADITASNGQDNTALMLAAGNNDARKGYVDVVSALLKPDGKGKISKDQQKLINFVGRDGSTALMIAAARGHDEIVGKLLEAKANPDVKAKLDPGNTALMDAADAGHLAVVEKLFQNKVKVDETNKKKDTALIIATRKASENPDGMDILKHFVEIGANNAYTKKKDLQKAAKKKNAANENACQLSAADSDPRVKEVFTTNSVC
eukprot:gnl/TRDRNA2_/TRDRNA2_85491_c0_seq1.p1 gnl/TRDRNA2_/TRDRNA2_85491_c0~~gnl/TRDRNA2_/TRDRNA2_85491_c0_seq1.p1  ORF type:complete len:856 (-),score=216.39 gnl/TRDRNA2_/TRDRNA2_85491_c0_seq1:95-2614(-)